jgi:hypothetical protein
MTKFICVSGKAESGKDTCADIMRDILYEQGYRVLVVHNADLLKFICRNFFGWDGKKDQAGRELLQYVGTDRVRKQNPDYWIDFIVGVIDLFKSEFDWVIIPDTRFENEINRIKTAGYPVYAVRVERPGHENKLTPEQRSHPSETSLDAYDFKYRICNAGEMSDLYGAVANEMIRILKDCGLIDSYEQIQFDIDYCQKGA